MKDAAKVKSNMWCEIKCVAIAAYAIENQAIAIQDTINVSLQEEEDLRIDEHWLNDIIAEIQNLTRYFESFKKEYEEYKKEKM